MWHVVVDNEGHRHVVPQDDLKPHALGTLCWCRPRTTDDDIVVHNSMDGREHYETGERRAS